MGEVVGIRSGRLEGESTRGVETFLGVPYAAAPRGALRWRRAQPVAPWQDVRPAKRFGRAAPQIGPAPALVRRMIGAAAMRQSEDCLYLNIWTPAADTRRRPVMVWLHGGAFFLGSGSTRLYDGRRLASAGNAVVVTINYRLGVLGFANLPAIAGSGAGVDANVGLWDQIAALEWVRDNIAEFGGDPDNVTVFGESAGGMSVATLMGTPRARGLFHKAIAQSGAAHNVASAEEGRNVAEALCRSIGVSGDPVAALRSAPVGELLRAQAEVSVAWARSGALMAWQPSLDGELLVEDPRVAIGKGMSADLPLLVGTNRDEFRLFMLADRSLRRLDGEGLRQRMASSLAAHPNRDDAMLEAAYREYTEGDASRGREDPAGQLEAFQSDRIFHHPALSLADRQSRHAPVYAYLFKWTPPVARQRLGACHGLELPFVFGTLGAAALRATLGVSPRSQTLAGQMGRAWTQFAHGGDPGVDSLPDWPEYESGDRSSMLLAPSCRVEPARFEPGRRFWEERDPFPA